MRKNLLITFIVLLLNTSFVNSDEKKDCSSLKKLSKEFVKCKSVALQEKVRGINPKTGKVNTQAEYEAAKTKKDLEIQANKIKNNTSKKKTKTKADYKAATRDKIKKIKKNISEIFKRKDK